MTITKRIKSLFVKPELKLVALMPELRKLQSVLKESAAQADGVVAIVPFFGEMSKWHDRMLHDIITAFKEVNYGQHDETIAGLEMLQVHFRNGGRERFGWNRTGPGEQVTDNNVFLGGIFGIWTFSVADWKKKKNQPAMLDSELTAYQVVGDNARHFIESHAKPMITIIDKLALACRN